MTPIPAYVGLGANLGNAAATLKSAVAALQSLPDTTLTELSSLYRSTPLGPAGQNDYLNAVAGLRTSLPPHTLLAALQDIEHRHGRERGERWGPRTLDLDLLLFGSDRIRTLELTVPHPELHHRNFVVIPLLELAPTLLLPDGQPLATLAVAADDTGLTRVAAGPQWGN